MTLNSPAVDPNWIKAEVLADETEVFTSWLDIHDMEKFTILLNAVKSGSGASPGNLTFVLECSMDDAVALNKTTAPSGLISGDYDKLIDTGGVDAPVSSVIFSANGQKAVSISPEDTIRSVRLGRISAATTNAANSWTINAGYSGTPRS